MHPRLCFASYGEMDVTAAGMHLRSALFGWPWSGGAIVTLETGAPRANVQRSQTKPGTPGGIYLAIEYRSIRA